jgi:group II intron reverse transcriptase/maturase
MRKSKEHRKIQRAEKQLELFKERPMAPNEEGGVVNDPWKRRVDELLSRLEEQRALTETLLEEIVGYNNLKEAYEQVRRNGGSAGVDSMDVETLGEWLRENVEQLRSTLLEGSYKVNAVRKVEIPKPNGGVRTLGIPTAKDRLIQQAIHQKMNIHYDPYFSESSFGFRPNRSAHQALEQALGYVAEGREWVVDIDLEKFFDKINHDRLMQRLSKGIGDKRLLRLINAFLQAGMMNEGLMEQRTEGTPQGGPLSPLLSNIVLDELDKELERRGHKFCRYADDCNIYVKSRKAGERVMETVIEFIEKKLKLRVNREKSGVRHCTTVKFLGFTIQPNGGIRVADKSEEKLKDKLRKICQRNRGIEFSQMIKELNATIIGWAGYFRKANTWLSTYNHIDSWLRRKLRCYRLKQCRRKYTIYKLLCSMGISERESWNVVMYSQNWWAMSKKKNVAKAMSNQWFAAQGLRSIKTEMTRN